MNFCHLCAFYGEYMILVTTSDSCENACPAVTGFEVLGGLLWSFADTRYSFQCMHLWPSPPLHWQRLTCLDPLTAVGLVGELWRCRTLQPAAGHTFGLGCDGAPVSLSISMLLALSSAGRARSNWIKQNLEAKVVNVKTPNYLPLLSVSTVSLESSKWSKLNRMSCSLPWFEGAQENSCLFSLYACG